MAIDEVLFESVAAGRSAPVLRLYRWAPAALTLGYAQKAEGCVDLAACRGEGIEVVRRATGGRAVLHDREVTYAVIAPTGSPFFPGGVVESYRIIADVLLCLLRSFGLEAQLAPRRKGGGEGGAACFAVPSSCELLFRGCKMTGSAQRRGGGALLQHGSIPVDFDLELLSRLIDPGASYSSEKKRRILQGCIGWLNRFLESPVSIEEVERRVVVAFSDRLGISFAEESLSSDEWIRARILHAEKYPNLAA